MRRKEYLFWTVLILLLALFIRVHRLHEIPFSLSHVLISGSISLLLREILPGSLWTACLIALFLLDLAVWGYRFIIIETDIAREWQIAHDGLPPDCHTYRVDSEGLQENEATLFGFHHVTGYDEFRIEMNKRLDELREENDSLEAMLGVRYRIQEENAEMPAGSAWRSIATVNGASIFERDDALPRAFLVHDVIGVQDLESALAVLSDSQHDWRKTAVVEVVPDTSCAIDEPQTAAAVDIVSYEANEIQLFVTTDATGWLVLSDQYYPGWRATIDDRLAPVQITNAALRGICVPAGTHDITFVFWPYLFPTGIVLSLLGVLLVIIAGFVQIKQRRVG